MYLFYNCGGKGVICDAGRVGVTLRTVTLNCSLSCCFLGFLLLLVFVCLFDQPPFFTESLNEIIQQDIYP